MDDFEDAYLSDSSSDEDNSPVKRFCDRIETNVNLMLENKPALPLDIDVLDPREVDYIELEKFDELTMPPPVIECMKNLNAFEKRECVVNSPKTDMSKVVDPISVHNWHRFVDSENNPEIKNAMFSFEDWKDIREYCQKMCEACDVSITFKRVRSCIIHVLQHGRFKKMNVF